MTTIDISPEAVERLCTCHPDDNPPRPCPQKYALTDCRIAALSAALTQSRAETDAAYERAAHEAWKYGGSGFEKAIRTIATPDQTAALDKLIAEAVEPYAEALRVLISHTHECERELTEALYHADFCGESRPLTDARAILAARKGESNG